MDLFYGTIKNSQNPQNFPGPGYDKKNGA